VLSWCGALPGKLWALTSWSRDDWSRWWASVKKVAKEEAHHYWVGGGGAAAGPRQGATLSGADLAGGRGEDCGWAGACRATEGAASCCPCPGLQRALGLIDGAVDGRQDRGPATRSHLVTPGLSLQFIHDDVVCTA